MKKAVSLLLMLMLALSSVSCAAVPNSDMLHSPEITDSPTPCYTGDSLPNPNVLYHDDMLADYEYLWKIMRENVGFFEELEDVGIDLQAVYNEYYVKIDDKEEMSKNQYLELLKSCLLSFNYAGHMIVLTRDQVTNHIRLAIPYVNQSPFYETMYDKLTTQETIEFYNLMEAEYTSEFSSIQPVSYRTSAASFTPQYHDGKTAYVQIRSMYAQNNLGPTIADIYTSLGSVDDLIIDIRGNGGGSSQFWMENLVAPIIGETKTWSYYEGHKAGDVVTAYYPEILDMIDWVNKTKGTDEGKEYEDELESLLALPEICSDSIDRLDFIRMRKFTVVEPAKNAIPFEGRIWMLIDQVNFSASEQYLLFMIDTFGVTTVGNTPTGGNGIGMFIVEPLPNTGIVFQFAPEYGFNNLGACNQLYGTKPDILAAADPLQVCLDEIAKLRGYTD